MKHSVWIIVLLGLGACSSVPQMEYPGIMKRLAQDSSCKVEDAFPGLRGTCYSVPGMENTGAWLVVAQDPAVPQVMNLGYVGPDIKWIHPVQLEPDGTTVESLEVIAVLAGNVIDDTLPEVLLHVRTRSSSSQAEIAQERESAYLITLGRNQRLVWYSTIRLKGSYKHKCRTGEVDIKSDILFHYLGPEVIAIDVNRMRLETICERGPDCSGDFKCNRHRTDQPVSWVLDEGQSIFKKFPSRSSALMIPDVFLEHK